MESGIYLGNLDFSRILTTEEMQFAIGLLVALITAVLFLNLWSVLYGRPSLEVLQTLLVRSVDNLFLKIRMQTVERTELVGYLRKLSTKQAHVVVPDRLKVGTKVMIHSDSLPDFPKTENPQIEGEVYQVRAFGSQPENYLVKIRFTRLGEDVRQPLENYLIRLGHGKTLVTQT